MSHIEELRKSIQSEDIAWPHRARLVREYHELMLQEHGQGQKRTGIGWSVRKTASHLGLPPSTVHLSLHVARCLDTYRGKLEDFKTMNEFATQMDLVRK